MHLKNNLLYGTLMNQHSLSLSPHTQTQQGHILKREEVTNGDAILCTTLVSGDLEGYLKQREREKGREAVAKPDNVYQSGQNTLMSRDTPVLNPHRGAHLYY